MALDAVWCHRDVILRQTRLNIDTARSLSAACVTAITDYRTLNLLHEYQRHNTATWYKSTNIGLWLSTGQWYLSISWYNVVLIQHGRFHPNYSDSKSGARFTNGISIAIQIRWKFRFTPTSILIQWSLQNFVHGTTAELSWHVQKFLALWWTAT